MRIETSWKLDSDGEWYPGESKYLRAECTQSGQMFLSMDTVHRPAGHTGMAFAYLDVEQAKILRANLDSFIAMREASGG